MIFKVGDKVKVSENGYSRSCTASHKIVKIIQRSDGTVSYYQAKCSKHPDGRPERGNFCWNVDHEDLKLLQTRNMALKEMYL